MQEELILKQFTCISSLRHSNRHCKKRPPTPPHVLLLLLMSSSSSRPPTPPHVLLLLMSSSSSRPPTPPHVLLLLMSSSSSRPPPTPNVLLLLTSSSSSSRPPAAPNELLTKYPTPVFHQLFLQHHNEDGTAMVWPVPTQSQSPDPSYSVCIFQPAALEPKHLSNSASTTGQPEWQRMQVCSVECSVAPGDAAGDKQLESQIGTADSQLHTASSSPSAWRRLLVANEWNELQTVRKTSPVLQLLVALLLLQVSPGRLLVLLLQVSPGAPPGESRLLLVLLLQVVGLVNLASSDLQVTLQPGRDGLPSPTSPILRYAIVTAVWLGLGLLQLLVYHLFYECCVEDKIRQFVDLCSVSNVSVLVLMCRCYGYYLHGRSVHGYAEVSIETLRNNLRNEEEDRCARRGLEPQSDVQVFEVALTERVRQQLDRVFLPMAELKQRRRHGDGAERQAQTARVSHNTNTLLCLFLQHALKDMDYVVKDKVALERIMKCEFQQPVERSMFYRDKDGVAFGEVLCCGKELLLLTFDLLLFSVIDLASQDLVLAAVLTYTVQQVLDIVRVHVSRRNLSSKTLVDQCFLI
ncbi:hypothetical protein ACEWY4_011461 [Coilia grayii]|uniref:Uncharacterized protein n=1 Tax=Coilia grayii TaxID=363190 RepID=A0ABD1K4V1_9TELE